MRALLEFGHCGVDPATAPVALQHRHFRRMCWNGLPAPPSNLILRTYLMIDSAWAMDEWDVAEALTEQLQQRGFEYSGSRSPSWVIDICEFAGCSRGEGGEYTQHRCSHIVASHAWQIANVEQKEQQLGDYGDQSRQRGTACSCCADHGACACACSLCRGDVNRQRSYRVVAAR